MPEARRFYIRTFGCQMNEHDSERIAGLLVADGMRHTDDIEQADVVVFNTCCVRENADNKLYGHLGRVKALKERRPDVQIAVAGCLAQKDREITLLGQNVNSYGRDLGAGQYAPRFADLLRSVDAVDGIRRIRYTSPHPKDLRPETIAAMAECDAVCEHLHLPLQAGSDRTLARMHRGYTADRYLKRLADARAAIADLAVTTDLIVRFPGETDDDFVRTL